MKDQDKTEGQLINESGEPHQQIAELGTSETEHKLAEEALQENKLRVCPLIDAAVDAIITINERGIVKSFNPAAERILGYTADEVIGQNVKMLMPSPYQEEHNDYLANFLTTGKKKIIGIGREVIGRRKDGTIFPMELAVSEIRLGEQQIFTGIMRDITERKRIEETLKETLAQLTRKNRYEVIINTVARSVHQSINLQEVLENSVEAISKNIDRVEHIAIAMIEGKEAVLKAYRGYPDWFIERIRRIPYPKGFTWKTIIEGKPMYCPDVDQDKDIGPAGREVGTKSYLAMPFRIGGKTAGVIDINSFQKNAFDEEELKLLEIVAQQIEVAINNAQQAEALRQSEERYHTLFDQSPVGVYIFDKQLKITQCNERLVQILHSSYDKIIGLDMRKLKDQSFMPAMEKVFEDRPSYYQEGFYEATTSSVRLWLSIYFAPLRDAHGNVIGGMGVVEDITERKKAEEELRSSREQLRSFAARLEVVREEERTRIAREIHDELNQTLISLKMSLSWLEKRLSKRDKMVPYPLLLKEMATMSKLIDTTFQAVDDISTELRPGVLDDLGLITAIEWQARQFQNRVGIKYQFISSPKNITLDKNQSTAIFRIFQEALTNVARHANATTVNIRLKLKASSLILEVRDNGKGIKKSKISDPKSFGLLGIRERVLLLKGDVKISSILGKGTTVTVEIPLKG